MGTRSITYFLDETKKPFASLYGSYDGYPTGHGNDVVKALGNKTLVNGFNDRHAQVNGIECAAALLISKLKTEAGGYYLYGPDASFEEYVYMIWPQEGYLYMSVSTAYTDRTYIRRLSEFNPSDAEMFINNDDYES